MLIRVKIGLKPFHSETPFLAIPGNVSFTNDGKVRENARSCFNFTELGKYLFMSSKNNNDLIRPIAHLKGVRPEAPRWFDDALNVESEEGSVDVNGTKIAYSAWGDIGARGLLFIHGGRAHRNWWRPFAPFFSKSFRVAALDLSGMGDSGWRETYSIDCMVDEIFAVIKAAGLDQGGRPLIVGHSFGGWMALAAVEREGDCLAGAVVIDSPLGEPDPHEGYTVVHSANSADKQKQTSTRVYNTIEEPIARFRFLPNQLADEHYLVDYIARMGLHEVDNPAGGRGWTWKFDPGPTWTADIRFERGLIRASRCPLAFIYGEKSLFVQGDSVTYLREQARGRSPFIMMPDSHHHLMMDHPMAFITTLRTLFSCWPIRVGG